MLLASARDAVRSRSRVFWIVAGLTTLAAALRFATLGVQAYHHDEIVTANRVLRGDFWHAMDAVGYSESAPPLYYVFAWLWTQVTGTAEYGLRSLSALAGVATVPVAYLLGTELRDRRAGIAAAAIVAVNPMLLWYSQEARGYSLLVLFSAIATLYFVRALDGGARRDFRGWGIASALALATHYFAFFPILFQGLWLLWRRGRAALSGLWIVALTGLLLAPLVIHQASYGHAEWIGGRTLGHRLWETGITFAVGEIGDIIARPERPLLALAPLLLMGAALLLPFVRRGNSSAMRPDSAGAQDSNRTRLGVLRMLAMVAATVAMPLVISVAAPSKDFVLARNLLPALVPLLAAVGVAVSRPNARRLGAAIGGALVAYSLGFCIWASVSSGLQRPDWDSVAGRLGEASAPRAMVTWTLGEASLRYYLPHGAFQAFSSEGFQWLVHEIDLVSDGPAPPVPSTLIDPRFRQVSYEKVGRLYVRSYEVPGPELAPLRLGLIRRADLKFHSNGVLLDGIGAP